MATFFGDIADIQRFFRRRRSVEDGDLRAGAKNLTSSFVQLTIKIELCSKFSFFFKEFSQIVFQY